jgi:hypothetical protein
MSKKSGSGSGIRNEQPGSYFLELRNHFYWVKILKPRKQDPDPDADPDLNHSGSTKLVLTPGMERHLDMKDQYYLPA